MPSCPAPASPSPASSAYDTLSEHSAAEALPEEHSLYDDDCYFYTMYMTDDHHLVRWHCAIALDSEIIHMQTGGRRSVNASGHVAAAEYADAELGTAARGLL